MDITLLTLHISSSHEVVSARRGARQIAAQLGFHSPDQIKIATLVYLLVWAAYQRTDEVVIEYCVNRTRRAHMFKIKITDHGKNKLFSAHTRYREDLKKLLQDDAMHVFEQGEQVILEMKINCANIPQCDTVKMDTVVDVYEEIRQQNEELLRLLSAQKNREESQYHHQRDLARVEREHSLGEMATSLAHELNQPLAAIIAYLQGSVRHLKNSASKKSLLLSIMNRAINQTKRAGKIIHRMKAGTVKQMLFREKTDINHIVQEAVLFVDPEAKKQEAFIQVELCESLPWLNVDALQLKQAFVSLLLNALQVMKKGHIHFPCIILKSFINEADDLEVDILDNGIGFNARNSDVLPETPTGNKNKDLDLRLSIARTIMVAHGGQLLVHSHSGEGGWFKCILPINKESEK